MKYEEYKDSGVAWIGENPSHWEVAAFKRRISINNGRDYKEFQDDEIYPVMGSGGCFAYCSRYMYDGEALLLGRKGTIDKPLYINGKFWTVDTMFYAIPNKDLDCKFAYYLAITFPFNLYSTSTALPSMTQTDLGNNPVAFPPLVEQQAITSYLDKKCGKINGAIDVQIKKIDLLNELKQTIITNAVTKGLNPNAPMKDSGVEWIGQVPEHWEVMKLKRCSTIKTGCTPPTSETKYYDSEDINWYTPADIGGNKLAEAEKKISSVSKLDGVCRIFPERSIYFIGIGATIGKVSYCDEEASSNQQINAIIPNKRANYKFLTYVLKSQKDEIYLTANTVTLPIINQDRTGSLLCPIPSIEEQAEIVQFIETETERIDAHISKANRRIELLNELKQSIITEAVTGKIKVC